MVVAITAFGVAQLLPSDHNTANTANTSDTAAGPAGVTEPAPGALDVAGGFLDAFSSGDAQAAAALTDDPAAATATLTALWRSLSPASVTAGRDALVAPGAAATTAAESFTLTWDLGAGRAWTYDTALELVRDKEWRVRWDPALVHPDLTAGHSLALRDQTDRPAVVDRDGGTLLTWTATGTAPPAGAIAPVLLPGMGRQAARGAWYVALVDSKGTDVAVLHGTPAPALKSTVSRPVQLAAQAAVDTQRQPTMLVAIRPSTGDLLAVAQNSAAGNGPVALQGLFPPGSTFKIATATALVEAGRADVGTVVPCPGSVTVGGRTIRNADFELGDVPLRTAFAQSCNTTFALGTEGLPPDALPRAADQLGLGADFLIPGVTTELGSVPSAADPVQQVENSIGQGTVQVSCLGMALVSATVAAGHAVTPRLWPDHATEVTAGYEAPPPGVIGSLRTMMRDVVTSGRAKALAGLGAVHGKTGTAETGGSAHGWFTGFRDDLAFTVLVQDGQSSSVAVGVTKTFLGALG